MSLSHKHGNWRRWAIVGLQMLVLLAAVAASWLVVRSLSGQFVADDWRAWSVLLASFGFIGVASFLATVRILSPLAMYHPKFNQAADQELAQNEQLARIEIDSSNGRLKGWFWQRMPGINAPIIIYYGGNTENSATKLVELIAINKKRPTMIGYNFVFVDYPTYGQSGGVINEQWLRRFSLEVFDSIKQTYRPQKLVVIGYSTGSGVANFVASERDINGLILLAPYATGFDLFNNYLNIFHGPLKKLSIFKMESIKFAAKVQIKPLILASKIDEVVPYFSSLKLSKTYPNGSIMPEIGLIDHRSFWQDELSLEQIENYLASKH